MNVHARGFFTKSVQSLESLTVAHTPYARASAGMKYVYCLTFGQLDVNLLPVTHLLGAEILEILKVWNSEEVVELTMDIPALEERFVYR